MSGEGPSDERVPAPVPPELGQQARDLFAKTSVYLQGQLQDNKRISVHPSDDLYQTNQVGTADEYRLIEEMNKAVAQRYSDMTQVSGNVARSLGDLNAKLDNLRPYLDQIDQIDEQSQVSGNVARSLGDLNAKLDNLLPYLDQIDQIDEQSQKLEEAAYAIDTYAKNLEARFKTLEKRGSS